MAPRRFCLNCGATAQEADIFCSNCGHKIEGGPWESWGGSPSLGRSWYMGLAALALGLTLVVLGLGAVGAFQGFMERSNLDRGSAQLHYDRGLGYLEEGNYPLAVAEFEEAVRLNPTDTEAQRQLLRARTLVESQAPTSSEALDRAAELLYQGAQDLYGQGDFWGAIEKLEQLRRLAPQFSPTPSADLLFESYLAAAQAEVDLNDVPAALDHLAAALALRPEDEEAVEGQRRATLYLEAKGLWGQDWPGVVERLAEIYAQSSEYADVPQLLAEAHRQWGNILAEQEEWCQAEREFGLALDLSSDPGLRSQRDDAARRCRAEVPSMITPTPKP
ncbi:MAG: tetratricopeptide repeat protein [Chloroflexi bacterium]|nr:tetratricopeptide repeat protein [Chloroflexota bacterium]